jgi:hypothetical protein
VLPPNRACMKCGTRNPPVRQFTIPYRVYRLCPLCLSSLQLGLKAWLTKNTDSA